MMKPYSSRNLLRRKPAPPPPTVSLAALDRIIGHPLPPDTIRPQAELRWYQFGEWDGAVWRACEVFEQRKSGRNRGQNIEVVCRKGTSWETSRNAAEIYVNQVKGHSNGVFVYFEDEGDTPVRSLFGALVKAVRG